MSFRLLRVFVIGGLFAGIASSQYFPQDLQKYLKLSDAQVKSITDLNAQLGMTNNAQVTLYYQQQDQATAELSKVSPDPGVIGAAYAQMEMIRRGYNQLAAQEQGKVGSVLTVDQVVLVNALLNVVRLQPLVVEATCAHLAFNTMRSGDFTCQARPLPTAVTNYLNLTDSQISAIENANLSNQDYLSRQSLQITELQNYIRDLTAAEKIDAPALGAAYLAITQIQRDGASQTSQLTTTVRSVLNDAQKTLLGALDNAASLNYVAIEAVSANILVLPPDLQPNSCVNQWFNVGVLCIPTALERTGDFGPSSKVGRIGS